MSPARHTSCQLFFFFFNDPATTEIYTLSLHDALPILNIPSVSFWGASEKNLQKRSREEIYYRSEEHTSELQSRRDLVCRLLLEKKKITNFIYYKLTFYSTSKI